MIVKSFAAYTNQLAGYPKYNIIKANVRGLFKKYWTLIFSA